MKSASIILRSGGTVDPWHLQPEDIEIMDIVLALSQQCRFSGHTPGFYSVAEHSVLVAEMMQAETNDPMLTLAALLHDAAEAYLGDVARPVRQNVGVWYPTCERRIMRSVAKFFCLPEPVPDSPIWEGSVLAIDNEVLRGELLMFFEDSQVPSHIARDNPPILQVHWMPPAVAALHFLRMLSTVWQPQDTEENAQLMACYRAIEKMPVYVQ